MPSAFTKPDLSEMDSNISPDSAYHQGDDKSVRVAIVDFSHIADFSGNRDKVKDYENKVPATIPLPVPLQMH